MAQELKPGWTPISWRDEARYRLREALGHEWGERLGEGLLGESEEEKYMQFLQRNYGYRGFPRDEEGNIDIPQSRPMREAMLDPSDFGMADKLLMILSGGGSIYPRVALGSGLTESGMLMGDAKGMIDKGETVPGAVTAALAGLPPAVAAAANRKTFADLGKDAVSGIGQFMKENVPSIQRNVMTTPEGVDVPLYFSRGSDNITGGGSGMQFDGKLQGMEENFPDLLKSTKGSSMGDNILGDPEINTGDLENALAKYNLGFDDMKRIDIDSPEIYNDTVAEGRDLLEELELLTYPRTKKPIFSQEYNEGMGTLDFYDTDSGPIGIMQMDIDDSIDDVVFFIPKNKNVTGGASRLDNPAMQGEAAAKAENMLPNKISATFNSRQYPGHFTDKVSTGNSVSATVKGDRGVSGAEVIDNIVKDLQQSGVTGDDFLSNQPFSSPVRMEGVLDGEKVVFSSTPIGSDEYIVSLRKMGVESTKVSPIDKQIDDLGRELYDLQNELNQEGGLMSVKNYLQKTNKVIELQSQIKSLKR